MEERVKLSLDKLKIFEKHFSQGNIERLINSERPKNRIVGKKGTEFIALELDDVAYFFTEHKIVFVRDFSGRQLILDRTLTELEDSLDMQKFFRLNRKFIAHYKSIVKFKPDNGRIRIFLIPELREEVHVSKETAPGFRLWINR
jgi:DNA-binding LytR/AlgR family response regulator